VGNGWAHTYSTNVQVQSDPYIGVGLPYDACEKVATTVSSWLNLP